LFIFAGFFFTFFWYQVLKFTAELFSKEAKKNAKNTAIFFYAQTKMEKIITKKIFKIFG